MKQPESIPGGAFFRILIPAEPRQYPGQRWFRMIVRATHVLLAGIYLGALVFHVEPAVRAPWFRFAILSGLLMLCLDLYESGGFLLQLRGLVISGKLLLLLLLPRFGAAGGWVVAVIAFCSVISSHASSSFRHYLIWGRGRIKAAETKG
jgi:hypothetical protein